MKKGLLLAVIISSFIIVSCAEHDHPFSTEQQKVDITAELKNLTREEAYQKTANDLYMGALSTTGFNNLLSILTSIEKGNVPGHEGSGIGDITSPYVAAVILQNLYDRMTPENLAATMPGLTQDIIDNLSAIRYPSKLENPNDLANLIQAFGKFPADYYNALVAQFKTVVDNQDLIGQITEHYANRLLTTSSSASKPSGSDDNVSIDNFNVVVNVASTISEAFNANVAGTVTDNETVISLISDSLYNLTDKSKMQLTYNQSLRTFKKDYYPQIADNNSLQQFSKVLTMYVNYNGKTDGPQKGDTVSGDNVTVLANPYNQDTDPTFKGGTSATIYEVIAKRLYGAPYDPYANTTDPASNDETVKPGFLNSKTASNVATDNALYFYQKLREYGLKIPYQTVTSLAGHKAIADTISSHLRANGITYSDFNVSGGSNDTTFQAAMTKMFDTPKTADGIDYPVCALIEEVNRKIDESASGHFANEGDYKFSFLGVTTKPTAGNGVQMTTSNTNKCKITLTKVYDNGTIEEYPYDNNTSVNQITTTAEGGTGTQTKIYTTQDNSTGL